MHIGYAKGQTRLDEFSVILLAGLILIGILLIVWNTAPITSGLFLNVTPSEIRTNIQWNTSSVVLLDLNGTATNVTLSVSGEIRPWVSFSKNKFDLKGFETIEMTISVPPSADNRSYASTLTVSYDTQKLSIPLTVVVSSQPVENLKLFSLGSFVVSGGAVETLDSKQSISVSQGYLGGSRINLFGSVDSSKLARVSEGLVTIFVDDTNGLGNIVVTLNGEKIFDKKAEVGELRIAVNKSLIKDSNTVTMSAGPPGFAFWAATGYKLRSAAFSLVYPAESREFSFTLNRNEVENFKYARVTFTVGTYQQPLTNLKILVNDQLVYIQSPPLAFFRDTFSKTIFGDKLLLNTGSNKISFAFDGHGYYSVADGVLVVAYSG